MGRKQKKSEELASKRSALADARKATLAKVAPLAAGVLLSARLLRGEPWLMLATSAIAIGLAVRSIVQYRRLRLELGLQGEYDELDEKTTALTSTLLILFGVFGGMFALIFALITLLKR